MVGASDTSFRRKSFGFFTKPTITAEALNRQNSNLEDRIGKSRPKSFFGGSGGGVFSQEVTATVSTDGSKSRISVRARPKSMFGSLKGKEQVESSNTSSSGSIEITQTTVTDISHVIVHCGEAMSTGGLLRRKKEYFVLTDSELLRFKSYVKAVEALGFSDATGKTSGGRSASFGSMPEVTTQANIVAKLSQVIAVYQPNQAADFELSSSMVQIDYLDEVGQPVSTTLQLANIQEAQKWLLHLTKATYNVQVEMDEVLPKYLVDYCSRRLEAEKDYVPGHVRLFRVSQRGTGKSQSKPSASEDLSKIYSSTAILAIGYHKIHLLPVPKLSSSKSASSLNSQNFAGCFTSGLMNVTELSMSPIDDSFLITTRLPMRSPQVLHLASSRVMEIIQCIRQRCDFLRPEWQVAPFELNIPEYLIDVPLEPLPEVQVEDYNGFERTLIAYCQSYNVDVSNIAYAVRTDVEDSPQFVLHAPVKTKRRPYNDLELLAVFRALRWNESFASVSLAGINLDALRISYDNYGQEYEPKFTRSQKYFNIKGRHSLLIHELRGLAVCSTRLRRIDFSSCYTRVKRRNSGDFTSGSEDEPGCGLVEALMPLCRRGLTNIDWFIFNGIELVEADLDYLIDAAANRLAHLRGFEMRRCGLTERMLTMFLNALAAQENTLEALDISGNPGRLHPPYLNDMLMYFPFLRKLSLSRVLLTAGPHPLLSAEVLLRWRLESLDLSETHLNPESVDAVSAYLHSDQSESLHHLNVAHCGLTSREVAVFMHSMSKQSGRARDLHMNASNSNLAKSHDKLLYCIENGITPSRLTLRMTDYPKEEMFREFLRAVARNKTLEYLDISKVSLPFEATDETCSVLQELFEVNTCLKELDISGEQTLLETSRIFGLNKALTGLASNNTLEILKVELQSLGNSGAMVLSSILQKNSTLRELHCEKNKVSIQGFTALVNSLENNTTLLYLPFMEADKNDRLKQLRESFKHLKDVRPEAPSALKGPSSLMRRRSLSKDRQRRVSFTDSPGKSRPAMPSRLSMVNEEEPVDLGSVASASDVENLIRVMDDKWSAECARLTGFLERNAAVYAEQQGAAWNLSLYNAPSYSSSYGDSSSYDNDSSNASSPVTPSSATSESDMDSPLYMRDLKEFF